MNNMPDSVTRTVLIAVIAGALFAGFLALTPRLTAGTQTSATEGPAAVVTAIPELPELPAISIADPVISVPEASYLDGFEEEPVEEEWIDETPVTTTMPASGPTPDGTLTLTVELLGPRDGKETVILEDEDMVDWHFRATNSSSEELWGVYVYLEGYGHVTCDDTYLAPGETTDCWAATKVWTGEQSADAWATAWTLEPQVADEISYDYYVG